MREAVPVLQINQQPGSGPHLYRISVIAKEIPDRSELSFDCDLEFTLTPADGERLRWYLEDYLQFDQEPAPQIARGVEAFMADCGEELFRKIFRSSDDATALWSNLEPHLSSTRIEINAGITEATAIPWELIRNPRSRTCLALSAAAFVRSQRGSRSVPRPAGEAAKVRILLVICRPQGAGDAPFRSVAGRLVTRLNDEARDAFDIDVLRPPTFEQLAKTLRLAKERGQPYHVVHFDGHGVYADPKNLADVGKVLSNLKSDTQHAGAHGFLLFEDPENKSNSKLVDGFRLGELLRDESVPVLVLNACQSAFAEARPRPETASPAGTRQEIEAYGSLAQAVMDAGAAGVVAMRYSVYVVTAAQFVAELYSALARGNHLGEAVTWARKNLYDQPDRQIAYEPRPLQDWSVPVVWEREPLRLWPEKPDAAPLRISLEDGMASRPGALDHALPARPDVGFYGRDETLYALDRAFDTHRIVLLHAYAGSGKTSTAAEFARWYALTGGVKGPVLFTSFERHLPLARVLDKIGVAFAEALELRGVQWDAIIDPARRRHIALLMLEQVPVLWVWDNVEPVTGFPTGTASDWSAVEQQELREFLTAARETKAKFLLTSRRSENEWLGHLPRRVEVPAMPMQERLQLAGAIVERRGRRLAELPDLRALLAFTRGNPMTILVTVGEALHVGIDTTKRLEAFVAALHDGEVDFEDEETEGRSKSLAASLSYGFAAAFDEDERKVIALLHLFQGVVGLVALEMIIESLVEPVFNAAFKERAVVLLDRAVEIGLLNICGGGYYGIHPALPWHFHALFEKHFSEVTGDAGRARSAFIAAMGALSTFYHRRYYEGNPEMLSVAAMEEDNLLKAWSLARTDRKWDDVLHTMQGLHLLYEKTGRHTAWRRLVEKAVPDFIDSTTQGPLPGREDNWSMLNDYRVHFAIDENDLDQAERLQNICVDRDRENARRALAIPPEERSEIEYNDIRSLAVSLHDLAEVQRQQGRPVCAKTYRESLEIAESIGDSLGQASCAFNLGNAYMSIAELRDLEEAEKWVRKSLHLRSRGDPLGYGQCLAVLGEINYSRVSAGLRAKRPADELSYYLTEAKRNYTQALAVVPTISINENAIIHSGLGDICRAAGDIDGALDHYRQGLQYADQLGDPSLCGRLRLKLGVTLFITGRLADAREYAKAALANYRSSGDALVDSIANTERLIRDIDQAIANEASGP